MEEETFDFENLRVYQMGLDFVDKVYRVTRSFPKHEISGLADQFRRAAVSIVLNTAEGTGGTKAEFRRFLNIAKRSVRECVAVAEIAFREKYFEFEMRRDLRSDCAILSRMLNGLIKSVSSTAER